MEEDYEGIHFLRGGRKDFGGRAWSIGESGILVEFTVHRGAAEVLGSEG